MTMAKGLQKREGIYERFPQEIPSPKRKAQNVCPTLQRYHEILMCKCAFSLHQE